MENEVIEEIYNGFCKMMNETRSVFCEFEEKDGKIILTNADCAYGSCPNSETCLLMRQVKEREI